MPRRRSQEYYARLRVRRAVQDEERHAVDAALSRLETLMCASRNREHHIIHTTACPECGSKVGEPCYWTGKLEQRHGNRLAVHGARRKAWQAAGNPKTEHD